MSDAAVVSSTAASGLTFDNLMLRRLPVDPSMENRPRTVSNASFSRVIPTPLSHPRLLAVSDSALRLVGLTEERVRASADEFARLLCGNDLFEGSDPFAHCYCGHQFGSWAGQLGDGRAISLGEVVTPEHGRWEVQLKGAGKTPYSRFADGRAVLRSSIREFLCSEHMHALGVPTTRAMSIVASTDRVARDMFYDGNPKMEPCAVVARLAPTMIRFGSFEIILPANGRDRDVPGPAVGKTEITRALLDVLIEEHFKELQSIDNQEERYVRLFKEVVVRTARLAAMWQCVGFTHGVLNTDNMSILGLTIDYGPFGFMDHYDPRFVPNHSDNMGRYCYENQPGICSWNCFKLAEALSFIAPRERLMKELSENFGPVYRAEYQSMMRRKARNLGLVHKALPEDVELIDELLAVMAKVAADWTNSFRALSRCDPLDERTTAQGGVLLALLAQTGTVEDMVKSNGPSVPTDQLRMFAHIRTTDPERFARLMGDQLDLYEKEMSLLEEATKLRAMTPEEKIEFETAAWSEWLVKYQARLRADISDAPDRMAAAAERERVMTAANPKFTLRNYLLQRAIKDAENGDLMELERLLKLAQSPFDDNTDLEKYGYFEKRPESEAGFMLSCSS